MNLKYNEIFTNELVRLGTKFDYVYSLEIKWVLKWFKKIAKLEPFTISNLKKIEKILQKLDIKYISFQKNEYFSEEKMLFLKWNKTNVYIDIYISKSNKILNKLKEIILYENDYKKNFLIWKLLWYPDCCIKSFLSQEYTWDYNMNLKIKERTIWKFDWRLNNLINPYSLIPFFPCSYNCKNAIKYAENNLKIIWNKDEIKNIFYNIIEYNDFWNYKVVDKLKGNNNKNIFNFKN